MREKTVTLNRATLEQATLISDSDFERFQDFFYHKVGIHFQPSKRYFVDKRLLQRMRATKSRTFSEYMALLRSEVSRKELQALINLMTVNETYFFREEYQLRTLVGPMLDEIAARKGPGETIRIWSIPCSTGEEPYSIAIYLSEYWPGLARHDVELVASDINTDVLQRAREGCYEKRAVQSLPPDVLRRYFTKESDPSGGGLRYRIDRDLRDSVRFSPVNIHDAEALRSHHGFDVIFCRNLLIYFDNRSRRRAAESLYESLRPGGFICLGHSESMSRISRLYEMRRFPESIVYQRPATRRPAETPAPAEGALP